MSRDGRATAHSIISRQVTISGFDITSYRDVLTKVILEFFYAYICIVILSGTWEDVATELNNSFDL